MHLLLQKLRQSRRLLQARLERQRLRSRLPHLWVLSLLHRRLPDTLPHRNLRALFRLRGIRLCSRS